MICVRLLKDPLFMLNIYMAGPKADQYLADQFCPKAKPKKREKHFTGVNSRFRNTA